LGVFESGLLFFAIIQSVRVALGLLYRISLNDGVISRRAFGQPPVSIAIADVTSIVEPASDLTTLATSNEPFPGFTVNGRSASGASKTISVSTKYFVAQDVRWLMRTIQAARPDLVPAMGESALIREISKLADERTRRVVLGGLFGKYNAMLNPDVAALERELTQLRDRLLAEARARGFEVPENK
jgi:hypothetical protein